MFARTTNGMLHPFYPLVPDSACKQIYTHLTVLNKCKYNKISGNYLPICTMIVLFWPLNGDVVETFRTKIK